MKMTYTEFDRLASDHKFNRAYATDNAAPCRHCGSTCAHYRMQPACYPCDDVLQVFCASCHVTDAFTIECGVIPADATAAQVSAWHRSLTRYRIDTQTGQVVYAKTLNEVSRLLREDLTCFEQYPVSITDLVTGLRSDSIYHGESLSGGTKQC